MKAEIILKVDSLYDVINNQNTLKTQQLIKDAPSKVEDKLSYDITEHTIKLANEVVKSIESSRKLITAPLDAYKKQIMEIEKDAVEPIKKYIESAKTMMLAYNEELERIQREANEKLRIESEKALENVSIEDFSALAGFSKSSLTYGDVVSAASVTTSSSVVAITPVVAGKLGLNYDWDMTGFGTVGFDINYDFRQYINAFRNVHAGVNTPTSSSFSAQGIVFGLDLKFINA